MGGDLDYFYESDLDRTNLLDFHESLPISHMKCKFEASLNASITRMNVLQGYRGPPHMCNGGSGDSQVLHPSHGMQEIKYWWGLRKDSMWILGGGTVAYPLQRLGQKLDGQLDWSSLYFDSKTGECLSHDQDEAAEKLNKIGRRLYKEGKYSEAAEYHNNAYRACSKGYRNEKKFKNNAKKAESKSNQESSDDESDDNSSELGARTSNNDDSDEDFTNNTYQERRDDRQRRNYDWEANRDRLVIDNEEYASHLCEVADELYRRANYREAEAIFHEALQVSQVSRHQQICYHRMIAAENEKIALELNEQGDVLFLSGEYSEAVTKYDEASQKSQEPIQRQRYADNVKKAQVENDAANLNREGNSLFRQGEYSEARDRYQEAFDKSKVRNEREKYAANRNLAEIEVDAVQLNHEGHYFYKNGKYNEAVSRYEQAHDRSQTSSRKRLYTANRMKAQAEIDALQLYFEGKNLLGQRKYSEAREKFQDARKISKATKQIEKFKAMEDQAKIEMDAIQLNYQGDVLFQQGKYSDARNNYQEAYKLSQIDKEKIIYAANRDKAQNIITKLEMLDTLWKQAWDAENDESDEVEALFVRILSESKSGLEICPDNSKLIQYETLVILKLEGNELFNQGLEFQLNGITLFEEALELKQRENYESADIKFKQAKMKFLDAQEKFEKGKQEDPRFLPCIEFVKERIKVVTDSIRSTEQFMLSQGLRSLNVNDDSDNNAANHSQKTDEVVKQIYYSAQI